MSTLVVKVYLSDFSKLAISIILEYLHMKQFLISSILVLFMVGFSNAQVSPHNQIFYGQGSTFFFKEIQSKPDEIKSAVYLTKDWVKTTLYYKSEYKIENLLTKYDIASEIIEINLDTTIKILYITAVDSFEIQDANGMSISYKNCTHYKTNEYMHGFFRELVSGKIRLFEKPSFEVLEANYNIALDVGSKDRKYISASVYYVEIDGVVIEVPNKESEFMSLFGDQKNKVASYMKEHKLKSKKTKDIIEIIWYFNQLSV